MKKKLLSLLLAMIMVLGGTGILEVQAAIKDKEMQEAVAISLGTEYTANLELRDEVLYKFVPTANGVYTIRFKTNSSGPVPCGEIYNSAGKLIQKDTPNGYNDVFTFECILSAGVTYYLKAYEYEHRDISMQVSVKLSNNTGFFVDYLESPVIKYNNTDNLEIRVQSSNKVTYQWYYYDKDNVNTVRGDNYWEIKGATSKVYTIKADEKMYSRYACYVSDGENSEWCYISPRIDTGIELDRYGEEVYVQYGKTKTITVLATGGIDKLSYQWYICGDYNEETDSYLWPIEGATSNSFTINGTMEEAYYAWYICGVSDGLMEEYYEVYTYLDTGLRLEEGYKSVTFEYGKENQMSVNATTVNGELSYQWYYRKNGWESISGATESTYTVTGEEGLYDEYKCVVDNGLDSSSIWYEVAWDTGLEINGDEYVCIEIPEYFTLNLKVNATSKLDDLSYKWYYRSGTSWVQMGNYTTSSYEYTSENAINRTFKCKVSDSHMSKEVIFEINKVSESDFSEDGYNSVVSQKSFFKINGIEGGKKLFFNNIGTKYKQRLKLYDEGLNLLVDPDSDSLSYIFDSSKTYYLLVYSEAAEQEERLINIEHKNINFCANAEGEIEAGVLYGQNHTMKVNVSNVEGDVSYQWYYIDESNGENVISEATNATYTVTADENAHKKYFCKVTNKVGNNEESVDVHFSMEINSELSASISSLKELKLLYNVTKPIEVDVNSLCDNITYQWYYYSSAEDTEGKIIEGATADSYTLVGDKNIKYAYYCVVSDGISTVKTNLVYPKVDSGLKVFIESDYYDVSYGNMVNLEVEASTNGDEIKYEWYYAYNIDYETGTYDTELVNGVNTSTYSFMADGTSHNYILCKVSDGIMTKGIYFTIHYLGEIKAINDGFTVSLEYSSVVEDGTEKKPIVTVKNEERTLVQDRHYTVEYKDNVKPGTATVTIKGIGSYEGEITKTFTITAKPEEKPAEPTKPQITPISNATIKLAKNSYVYDGKVKKPSVNVVLNGKTLINGTDYKVSYSKNKQIGKATVTVTGLGKYNGTVKTTFNIDVKVGKTYTVGAYKYKVTSKSEVAFAGLKKATTKNVVVAGTVKIGGKKFKVTSIANNVLKKKTKVKSVTIGANVKKIGANAFSGCKNLKTITIRSTKLKSVGKNAFKGINSKAKIKVSKKKYNAYKKLLKGKGQTKNVKIVK